MSEVSTPTERSTDRNQIPEFMGAMSLVLQTQAEVDTEAVKVEEVMMLGADRLRALQDLDDPTPANTVDYAHVWYALQNLDEAWRMRQEGLQAFSDQSHAEVSAFLGS